MTVKTEAVRAFYRKHPYPSYGEPIKRRHIEWYRKHCSAPGRYLEAGCGTGHIMMGIATSLPQHQYWAIDLSDNSIATARQLAEQHGVAVDFRQHDMMQPLPFDFRFDYINCVGVIHHVESPETGLKNLADRLADDGVLFVHAYGEEYHRRRLQICELLDIMRGGEEDFEKRFALFESFCAHRNRLLRGGWLKRLYRTSARDLLLPLVKAVERARRRDRTDDVHTWYDEMVKPTYSNRWLDQFANPNDRTYNMREFCALIDSAGLEPIDMISVGRFRPEHLPKSWRPRYEQLSRTEQYRVMELLNPAPTSPTAITRKKRVERIS